MTLCAVTACPRAQQSTAQEKHLPAATAPETRNPATRPIIGWLDDDCMVVKDATLADGTPLFAVRLGSAPTNESFEESFKVLRGRVLHRLRAGEPCSALHPERRAGNESAGISFYAISLPEIVNLGIGVTTTPPVSLQNGKLDVDGDGKAESFRVCASREGIHFSVWSGEAYRGKELWHAYYYLGYDTDPNCPE
jgi:hypothetical protein